LLQLIDFDDGGFGHRLFDLATITRRSRHISHNDVFADAAIDGYCATREIDRDALMLFEALRACTYVGWNIKRMNEPSGNERNARYIAEAELAIERIHRISS
jgi:Ser/Thr protein kinase RdoA (MazF antagonist)